MLVELTRNIKLVRPEALAVYPYSNSLYIDDDIPTMIDAGSGGRAYCQLDTHSVQLILLTHYHFDHYNGASFFPNAKVMIGQEELFMFECEETYNKARGYDRWHELVGSARDENVAKLLIYPEDIPSRPGYRDILIEDSFKDGDIFDLGSTSVQAIHTPGHTAGHYAFYFPREEILFSGDYDASSRGPWYGDGASDLDAMITSVERMIALQPRILIGSHRRLITEGVEDALRAWLDVALRREAKLYDYLSEPRRLDDMLVLSLYEKWSNPSQHSLFWEKMMITKHLERMVKLGQVTAMEDGLYVRR
ncbi:MAG: MBL fold metallo-hydrolase [Syntrophomonadaceae bacterium]